MAKPTGRRPGNPAWRPGVSGNPAGKPRGTPTRFSLLTAQTAAATGASPVEILLAMARKDTAACKRLRIPLKDLTVSVRKSAAEAVAPYVNRKQPVAIDGGEGKPLSIFTPTTLRQLSDEEIRQLTSAITKAAILAGEEHGGEIVNAP